MSAILSDFPGGMTVEQLRAAFEREAERCEAQMLLCASQDSRWTAYRQQRVTALRRRAALTPAKQLVLELEERATSEREAAEQEAQWDAR